MIQEITLRLQPHIACEIENLKKYISKEISVPISEISHIEILNRSIDARSKFPIYNLRLNAYIGEPFQEKPIPYPNLKNVINSEPVHIIGAGPAGYFAAIRCLELGLKPIIIERGKDVKARVADLKGINVHNIVNEDSNYCFGEGGAGTYSDGKLYTRSKKRGNVRRILELLVAFGADRNILIEAHPHIGTNKLPDIIRKIREAIISHGGEIHFNKRVVDFEISGDAIVGITTLSQDRIEVKNLILATGHSARDIFNLLDRKSIKIEMKPLAIGVRVEHSQELIDSIQYHCATRGEYLPPSPYSVVKQIDGRGVYSFCMCPGGVIAPCATSQDEIVTNGWSSSQRSRPTANSGIVVELRFSDFKDFEKQGALAAMFYQKKIENDSWLAANKTQKAPAQRLVDFVNQKFSADLPKTSYPPGLTSIELGSVLPKLIHTSLQKGFVEIGKSMKGYFTNEAVVHAPETRTSSPVNIPRDPITLEHIQISGFYPCGEGAGYAGGIVSAAMDGMKVADAIYTKLYPNKT
ncbi:NAD(P)/FAD-dependent oxidoreductase [Leptospira sp. GIMC2001]|uniref:NAD(P)/FAD-dependent oxidoreductase n=1 Tax=Leptospira sp. GIMC2001 TaxID=1513297 RepID=UPI00234965D4|nr:NAD(P)/FAD-dependent oxidoreductase [Leptospira sp. GIMC2001]WCL48434.1 NAD(P)/FAD-dependent oxidoreductase [Leptospira sp. GIMC2001]